ncbi:hypothetical protein Gogos_004263 [Gossypium gossypioides]|uniref:Uncharacterized protein n=1 Tax=Gossypium gossypioides TaxID=34282 RepID=A0A7J9CFN6_GOSGO|nr:hypothetical protein [Gossypium gossypioides]
MSEILANSEENWRILLKSNSNAQNQTTCLGLTLTTARMIVILDLKVMDILKNNILKTKKKKRWWIIF